MVFLFHILTCCHNFHTIFVPLKNDPQICFVYTVIFFKVRFLDRLISGKKKCCVQKHFSKLSLKSPFVNLSKYKHNKMVSLQNC